MKSILRKIAAAELRDQPFRHLYIADLLDPEDFQAVVRSPLVAVEPCESDAELCDRLAQLGWQIKIHPGCSDNLEEYLRWHGGSSTSVRNQDTCEGFGVAFRLQRFPEGRLREIAEFFGSDVFLSALAQKFCLDYSTLSKEFGLHKYLDGYEISPHPDWRRKALTMMLNVNPSPISEQLDFHTHYLSLKPHWRFIQELWATRPEIDRCWVPWDWCDTVYRQTANNSLVAFAPGHDTFHAVRARYDHLATQRTQFYANLNVKLLQPEPRMPSWRDFLPRQVEPQVV